MRRDGEFGLREVTVGDFGDRARLISPIGGALARWSTQPPATMSIGPSDQETVLPRR